MHTDQVLEVYKTHLKNLTEFFCAKQYKFSLLTKLLGLSHNTKHINTKYRLFCDQNKSGDIATSYIPTDQQPANSFTKALSPIKFSLSISAIGLMQILLVEQVCCVYVYSQLFWTYFFMYTLSIT